MSSAVSTCAVSGCRNTTLYTVRTRADAEPTVLCDVHSADATPKTRCAGCSQLLIVAGTNVRGHRGPYRYSDHRLCVACRDADFHCGSCGTPAGFRGGRVFDGCVSWSRDGRPVAVRCAYCSQTALDSIDDAKDFITSAVTWLGAWLQGNGSALPDLTGRVTYEMVTDDALNGDSGNTMGLCTTTIRSKKPNTYHIQVITGLRPATFTGTLLHELIHVWSYEVGLAGKVAIEGFCNLVAYARLAELKAGRGPYADEAGRRMALMLDDTSPYYGGDFRAFELMHRNAPNILSWFARSADK